MGDEVVETGPGSHDALVYSLLGAGHVSSVVEALGLHIERGKRRKIDYRFEGHIFRLRIQIMRRGIRPYHTRRSRLSALNIALQIVLLCMVSYIVSLEWRSASPMLLRWLNKRQKHQQPIVPVIEYY